MWMRLPLYARDGCRKREPSNGGMQLATRGVEGVQHRLGVINVRFAAHAPFLGGSDGIDDAVGVLRRRQCSSWAGRADPQFSV
jgi:hypothetical protein